jgi:hypothetical protein
MVIFTSAGSTVQSVPVSLEMVIFTSAGSTVQSLPVSLGMVTFTSAGPTVQRVLSSIQNPYLPDASFPLHLAALDYSTSTFWVAVMGGVRAV